MKLLKLYLLEYVLYTKIPEHPYFSLWLSQHYFTAAEK